MTPRFAVYAMKYFISKDLFLPSSGRQAITEVGRRNIFPGPSPSYPAQLFLGAAAGGLAAGEMCRRGKG